MCLIRLFSFFFFSTLCYCTGFTQTKERNKVISEYLTKDLPDSALIYLEDSKKENLNDYLLTYLRIARYQAEKKKIEETEQIVRKVLAFDSSQFTDTLFYRVSFVKGLHLLNKSLPQKAIESFKRTFEIYHSNRYSDTLDLVTIYTNLANAYNTLYQYDSSSSYYKKVIPFLDNPIIKKNQGTELYWSLARHYNTTGQMDSALYCIQQAKRFLGELNKSNVYTYLALNTNQVKELYKAYRDEEALELVEENSEIIKEYRLDAKNLRVRNANYEAAKIYGAKGELKKAIRMLMRLYKLESDLYGFDHMYTAYNSLGIAETYQALQQYDSSLFFLDQAQKIASNQTSDFTYYVGQIRRARGNLFFEMDKPNEALEEFRQAYYIRKMDQNANVLTKANSLLDFTKCFLKLNLYDSAIKYLRISLNTNIVSDTSYSEIPQKPIPVYSDALMLKTIQLAAEIEPKAGRLNSVELGKIFLRWRRSFEKNFNNPQDLLHLTNVQDDFIQLLMEANLNPDLTLPLILELHENNQNKLLIHELELKNTKNSVLPDSLRIVINQIDQSINHAKNAFLNAKGKSKKEAEKTLQSAEKRKKTVLVKIQQTYPNYFNVRYEDSDNSIAFVRSIIRDDQVFLKYVLNGAGLVLIYVDKSQQQLITLDHRNLKEEVQKFMSLIDSPELEESQLKDFKDLSHRLFTRLLGPIQHLTNGKSLLINRDEYLKVMPFEALLTENKDNQNTYNSLSYLIKENAVSYIHSLKAFELASRLSLADNNIKVGAFVPKYDSLKLRWSNDEVMYIKNNFGAVVFENPENIKQKFITESSKYNYIHFAGHGISNDSDPMKSHLLFSDDRTNQVSAAEIYKMNLKSNMVVLSACRTGVGKHKNGEGMMSLSRAFLYAGAKTVVMTLWNINDRSSAALVKYFYEGLSKSLEKDKALQYAKIDYLKNQNAVLSHPYYWAGFVILGDTNQAKTKPSIYLKMTFLAIISVLLLLLIGRKYLRHSDKS